MTQKMHSIQEALVASELLGPNSKVRLVSISVDPSYDTPQVLTEYASIWEANLDFWHFLTGPEKETLEVITKGFKIAADKEPSDGSMGMDHSQGMDHSIVMPNIVHSTNFLLVDDEGWIRKIYHLDDPNLKDAIVTGVSLLLSTKTST
jgi:protein SCO1/2